MTVARHDPPRPAADRERIALAHPPVLARYRGHKIRVVACAIAQLVERRFVGQTVPREVTCRALPACVRTVSSRHDAAQHVLAERNPQPYVPAFPVATRADPVREAEVIR